MLPKRPLRILFLPQEIGNQMQLMAESLRAKGHYATAATVIPGRDGFVNEIVLNNYSRKGSFRHHLSILTFFLWAAQNYDIFHFHWGRSLLRYRFAQHFDLPILHMFKKNIFVHFRGSDIRNLGYNNAVAQKYMGSQDVIIPPLSLPNQLSSLKKWRLYSRCMFVSEPSLFKIVPDAVEIPQVIDLWKWKKRTPRRGNNIFRVGHAPTRRATKGTAFISHAVEELKKEGYNIELQIIEGINPKDISKFYDRCDVGVDQLINGWYGKVSLEMMAMGIPVISNIDENLIKYRQYLPIIPATPNNIKEVLKQLINQQSLLERLAEKSRTFVEENHSVDVVTDRLLRYYQLKKRQ